ncbi:MAG: succinate dehydrogenase, hydrophobic membrane anchor protein [bacterium]
MIGLSGSSRTGSQAWLWQRVSGVALVVLLIGHFLLKHFALEEPGAGQITYSAVVRQLSSFWWVVFELSLLVAALWHGFNGVWMVAADYVHKPLLRTVIYTGLWAAGAFLLLAGMITLIPFSHA